MATKNHAVQEQERSLKRALLYQLSYAPTLSQGNTSTAAGVLAENHNILSPGASGCGQIPVARPFRAHDYAEIVKAAESCVPEIIPDPDPEPIPNPDVKPRAIYLRKRRADWINGRGCAKCGSRRHLHIDHIDPSTKEMEASYALALSPKNPKAIAELAKCQVLCGRHHREKTANEQRKKK